MPFVNVNGYERMQVNTSHPMLADPRVREAIAYAIDKRRLVDTLTYGQMTQATEDIPDWMWAFNPTVKSYPHDPATARQLLREPGWRLGSDGIMHRNGVAAESRAW